MPLSLDRMDPEVVDEEAEVLEIGPELPVIDEVVTELVVIEEVDVEPPLLEELEDEEDEDKDAVDTADLSVPADKLLPPVALATLLDDPAIAVVVESDESWELPVEDPGKLPVAVTPVGADEELPAPEDAVPADDPATLPPPLDKESTLRFEAASGREGGMEMLSTYMKCIVDI